MKTRKLVMLALLTSSALMLNIAERLLPIPQPAPGVKLGLANIVTLFSLHFFSFQETSLIVVMRTVLSAAFGGGVSAFLFSITGGMLSLVVMWLLIRKAGSYFSLGAVSVVGALVHNIGQMMIASLIVSNFRLYYYLPVLLVSGVVTGLFIGLVTRSLLTALRRTPILAASTRAESELPK